MTKTLLGLSISLLSAAAFPAAVGAEEAAAEVTLYGTYLYSESGARTGIYSIKAEADAQPTLYWADGDMIGNGGAVYADDTYYILTYLDFFGTIYWGYQVCDIEKKEYVHSMPDNLDLVGDVAGTMGYDPSTATIYSVNLADTSGKRFRLTTMDPATGKKTPVAELPRRLFTLASTAAGQLYGVADDGILYKVDKYSGELAEVGATGLIPTENQSAVIDYATNVMYWSAYTAEGSGLYTVDLSTGKATHITTYDDKFQLTGLFLKQKAVSSAAPAAVGGLAASFEGASLNGAVNFTLPDKDTSGNPLSTTIGWSVAANGTIINSGEGDAGSEVSSLVTVAEPGMTRFVVKTSSNGTDGAAANLEMWVGMDTPQAVTNTSITSDGENVRVEWTLPERGIHDGYVDHSLVRYNIDRGPQDVRIATGYESTTFEESFQIDRVYPILYRITPVIGDLEGEAVITDWDRIGHHFNPPFAINFDDPFNSLVVDILDMNIDNSTWFYDYDHTAMACMWPISEDYCRDDWMITTPILFEPGFDYTLTLHVASEGSWNYNEQKYEDVFSGDLSAWFGTEPETGHMTRELIARAPLTEIVWHDRKSAPFTVDAEGYGYIGIHLEGGVERGNIYNALVRRIAVDKVKTSSIAAIANGEATLSAKVSGNLLTIDNPGAEPVSVVTVEGRTVASTTDHTVELTLPAGVYIVASPERSLKIAVK